MKWGFPDSPVVKNQLAIAGDMGSIPGQGTKNPHADIPQLLCYNKIKILIGAKKTQCKQINIFLKNQL